MLLYIYIYIYICHYDMLTPQSSMTLLWYPSLSSIVPNRSSGLHPVSTRSRWVKVFDGQLTLARPCFGVQKKMSFMSSSLLLQQYPACLTWMVCVIGNQWLDSNCFVQWWFQDSIQTVQSILRLSSSNFSTENTGGKGRVFKRQNWKAGRYGKTRKRWFYKRRQFKTRVIVLHLSYITELLLNLFCPFLHHILLLTLVCLHGVCVCFIFNFIQPATFILSDGSHQLIE